MKRLTTYSTLLLFLLGTNSAFGADFQKGWDASKKGDYAAALKEWRSLAEQGDANAQSNLGWMYDNGFGVLEDDKEAAKWYRLAADQGEAGAQFNLGWMYAYGLGVLEDDKEAVRLYRLAAEQGEASAQFYLGVAYAEGEGVLENEKDAAKWFRLATEQGDAITRFNRDWIYTYGLGVLDDDQEAVKGYRLGSGSDVLPNKGLRMPQGADKSSPTRKDLPLELRARLTSRDRWVISLGLVAVCGLVWTVMTWLPSRWA